MTKSDFKTRKDAQEDLKVALGAVHDNGFQNSKEYRQYKNALEFEKYCEYVDEKDDSINGITKDVLTELIEEDEESNK